MVTSIRDVAKAAGVSVATVSKVLNGYTTVNEQTKEKVLKYVKELQFRPNLAARSLVGRRSMTIGIFLTTGLVHPFFTRILAGMEQALQARGYDLIYLARMSLGKEISLVHHCQSRNVEGVVVFGFQHENADFGELIESGLPAVFIDLDIREGRAGYITSDNREAMERAVAYLADLRHCRLAYIGGIKDSYADLHRLAGFQTGLARAGISYREEYRIAGDFTREAGYIAMQRLLALPEPPTAVLCCSDMSAIGAIEAIRETGLSVPEDISVLGFDDIELAEYIQPALTTIRQDMTTIGRRAVELLDELIVDEKLAPPEVIVPTELVVRQSCGPAKV